MPGYLSSYIARSNGMEANDFIIPEFSHIFEDTYGLLVYQEQGMRLLSEMCGWNSIKVDVWRKAVGKKDAKKLDSLKNDFIADSVSNGQDIDQVTKLWFDMEEFGKYAFNKSHACAYSLLTYYTAYFKANYPSEFFASCITFESDTAQKSLYMENSRRNSIQVLPPDINQSTSGFNIAPDGSILFGFNGIKGLGDKVIHKLLSIVPFSSFGDFLIRTKMIGLSKAHVENLILAGAADSFGYKRSCMLKSFEKYILDIIPNPKTKPSESDIKAHVKSQDMYFIDDEYPELNMLSILEAENKLMGIYISGNPFDVVKDICTEKYTDSETLLNEAKDFGASGYVLCQIKTCKKHQAKNGNIMLFVDAIDSKGIVFSAPLFSGYEQYSEIIMEGKFLLLYLVCKQTAKGLSFIIQSAIDLTNAIATSTMKKNSNDIKLINLNFIDAPGTVQIKSLFNKVSDFISDSKSEFLLNINIDINGYLYNIKKLYLTDLSMETIRELNKISNIYLTKNINGTLRI